MKEDELLKEIKDRFKEAYDAANENYSMCIDDLNFENGDQWPQELRVERQSDQRPCLVLNKIPAFCKQIIGDIRQNEPSIKVKPVDSVADPDTAEIINGLIKNIEVQSEAEVVYDTAAESAVKCGIGAWRVVTEYSDDDTFNQDIRIRRIKNPLTIYWDPGAQMFDKSDARYCFVTEKISKDQFREDYPDASMMAFEGGKDKDPNWGTDKNIRVVEYFKKVKTSKKLMLIQGPDGNMFTTEEVPPPGLTGWQVVNERVVDSHKIMWWKANQAEILEGPIELPGKYIPIVMVYGEEVNIENKTEYRGLVRFMKDPQRLYNYSRSMGAEVTSLAPKSPYLVTHTQISNYKKIWDTANRKNFPYLPYDVDPKNPQAIPKRAEPISINTGIREEILISDQEMHDTAGLQLASLGKKSNEKSGRAILARQREGDVANFIYPDNLGRAIKYTGKILVDLIPKIYDTARVVRITMPNGSDVLVPINQPFEMQDQNGNTVKKIFDLTVGKYDVTVSLGPSYTTQREEAAENMMRLIEMVPAAGPLIADMLVKNLDFPGAQEIERRLKLLLPPALQGGDGGPPSPPPPPSPMDQLALKNAAADVIKKDIDNERAFYEMQRVKRGDMEKQNEVTNE